MIRYIEGSSPLHLLDARLKLAAFACASFVLLGFKTPAVLLGSSAAIVLLYPISGIGLRRAWDDVRVVLLLACVPLALQAFVYPGATRIAIGPLPISVSLEGLSFGAQNGLALLNALALAALVAYTTSEGRIASALTWLRMPPDLSFAFSLSLRFIPVIAREAGMIRLAQAVRGTNASAPANVFAFLVPTAHKVFRRAEQVSIALESRGFSPESARKTNKRG